MRFRSLIGTPLTLLGNVSLHSLGHIPAGKQDSTSATEAFEADIGPDPHHDPVGGAAGMRFSQSHDVLELDFRQQSDLSKRSSPAIIPSQWALKFPMV